MFTAESVEYDRSDYQLEKTRYAAERTTGRK